MRSALFRGLFLFLFGSALPAYAEDPREALSHFIFYADDYPPLNYQEDGEAKGYTVDVLKEVLARLDVKIDPAHVLVVPWARGYTETQQRQGTVLFATVRTPEREKLFEWVGPLGPSSVILFARKEAGVKLAGPETLGRYTYGVVHDDIGEQLLRQMGVERPNMVYMTSALSAGHLLARGRVDMWAYERIVAYWVMQRLGYKVQDFEVVHEFAPSNYYYAFNKDTPKEVLALFQKTLEEVAYDGTLKKIAEGYVPGAGHEFVPVFDRQAGAPGGE